MKTLNMANLLTMILIFSACGGGGGGKKKKAIVTTPVVVVPKVAQDTVMKLSEGETGFLEVTGNDPGAMFTITQPPAKGTINMIDPTTGEFEFIPSSGSGVTTFEFQVSNPDGSVSTGTYTVEFASNASPIAAAASYTQNQDTTFNFSLNGSDADGDVLTYAITSSPLNGTLTLNNTATGAVTYVPAPGDFGVYTFNYSVTDQFKTASATVTLNVNQVVVIPITAKVAQNATLDLAQVQSGILNTTGNNPNAVFSITQEPAKGSVTVNASTGEFQFNPNGKSGVTWFDFQVANPNGPTSTARYTVYFATNSAPVAAAMTPSMNEDASLTFTLAGTDADGDVLTYSLNTTPASGTLTLNSSNTGSVTYVPEANTSGVHTFNYTVSDSITTASATVTLTVNAVNDAPTMTAMTDRFTTEGTPISINITIDEGGSSDENTQVVVLNAKSGNAQIVPNNNVIVNVSDSGNGGSGTILITPRPNQFGIAPIILTLSDGITEVTSQFLLSVGNIPGAPIAWHIARTTAKNTDLTIDLSSLFGAEGAGYTYVLVDYPLHGEVSGTLPNVIYTPDFNFAGRDTIRYQVINDIGESNTATLTILVAGKLLFIVADPNALNAGDTQIKARMLSLGFEVTMKDDNLTATADANGKDLIVISSSSASANINTKYTNVAVPIMTWERFLYDDLQLSGAGATDNGVVDLQSQINVTNATHPLAAGLSGTFTVFQANASIVWGKLNDNAQVVATVAGDPTKPVLFVYEKDEEMAGGLIAPARRVGYFLPDNSATTLTPAGLTLLDAAINSALVSF
ncbi:MAG: tandem-95 repeat protein [Bacteriovoracaceae bacterium]|nr:tandem-95 repeat protein [Bacteriovoracaceae bacterium]